MGTDEKLEKHGDLFVEDVGEPRSIGADLEHDGSPRNVPQASGAEERRYLRKLDAIILPMIALLYFFEYIDRSNIANAKLLGLDKGHDTPNRGVGPGVKALTATQWQMAVMIFYVGLSLLQIPGSIGYRVFSPSKWIAFGVCGWCVVCVLQTTVYNLSGLLACRVFLGAFEGLFGTGIVYYLSLWYHRDELSVRLFWYLGSTAFAGAFGGLIAYGVGHVSSSVPDWKILFVVEGVPGFILGLSCLYWLPDRPKQNSRFKGRQQQIAIQRYERESKETGTGIARKHFVSALGDWKTYAQASIYFTSSTLIASISGFLPSIVQGLGYTSSTSANLMTVPPYAAAFALMFITSYSSDRMKERGYHIAVLSTIAAVMYLCLANLPDGSLSAKYACVCIAVSCVYSTYPPGHAWAANNFGNESKRAIGMGAFTALGNLGSIAGAYFYPSTEAPLYRRGHYVCFAMALCAAVFALGNSLLLQAINRKRDMEFGTVEGEAPDVTELADGHPMFRYIT